MRRVDVKVGGRCTASDDVVKFLLPREWTPRVQSFFEPEKLALTPKIQEQPETENPEQKLTNRKSGTGSADSPMRRLPSRK